jgi:hypothetical protein
MAMDERAQLLQAAQRIAFRRTTADYLQQGRPLSR